MLGMRGATIAGKVGYAASCLLAAVLLVVSGYAHKVNGLVTGLASSNAISGGAQTGAMNILLMGLESRTDYQGNTLSVGAADRDARGQRVRGQQRGRRRPGHEHADPDPHLRGRAAGGRLLDPAR